MVRRILVHLLVLHPLLHLSQNCLFFFSLKPIKGHQLIAFVIGSIELPFDVLLAVDQTLRGLPFTVNWLTMSRTMMKLVGLVKNLDSSRSILGLFLDMALLATAIR